MSTGDLGTWTDLNSSSSSSSSRSSSGPQGAARRPSRKNEPDSEPFFRLPVLPKADFFIEHRTVQARFIALFGPAKDSVEDILILWALAALASGGGLLAMIAIVEHAGEPVLSVAALPSSYWRHVVHITRWMHQHFLKACEWLCAQMTYPMAALYCTPAITCAAVVCFVALLGMVALCWAVTLHEWSLAHLLPSFIPVPLAYAFDHLLLVSPLVYLGSRLGPFSLPPHHAYPLLVLWTLSGALDWPIASLVTYPIDVVARFWSAASAEGELKHLRAELERSKAREAKA